jgi:hypothetical protein
VTSQQDGTGRAADLDLLLRSTQIGRVLITQDEDFLVIAATWQDAGWEFNGVVFARHDPSRTRWYTDDIELIAHCCAVSEVANQVIHLPLP